MRILAARQFLLHLAVSVAFLASSVTTNAQQSKPATNINEFAGTWHWMFNGQPFVTMVLEPVANGLTGSVGNASIDADQDGKITNAVPLTGSSPIIKSSLANGILHVVCRVDQDEIEWLVRLTSSNTVEIMPGGADAPKMTIHAEKSQ